MLDIRDAIKTVLGASFTVSHTGPQGVVTVTVNVGDAGRGDELALPAVFVLTQFGTSDPTNIGGGAVENRTFCELSVETLDADNIDGPKLIKDIHSKIETLVRSVEKTLGGSYYSFAANFRDYPPRIVSGIHVYKRLVAFRAQNHETY